MVEIVLRMDPDMPAAQTLHKAVQEATARRSERFILSSADCLLCFLCALLHFNALACKLSFGRTGRRKSLVHCVQGAWRVKTR